ncbi:MAG: hypothetical protein WCT20_01565 [Candidatus Babeliales bacterium]|jgi:hypothetical protein
MKKWWLGVFVIGAVFSRIYFHNALIKMNYEKQRLERGLDILRKEHAEVASTMYALKDSEKLQQIADQQSMAPLTMAALMTATVTTTVDFLGIRS